MTRRLQDHAAIVTGGGVGIGRVYSHALAAEGCRVVVADIDGEGAHETVESIRRSGGDACAMRVDVALPDDPPRMARAAMERYGRIDILVNNAALFTALPLVSLDDIEVEEWDRVMAVNLRGPFLCVKAVVPHMRAQQRGKIINVSSGSILRGNAKRLHYVTAKAGLIGFTRSLARALGEHNICVNPLLPRATASATALRAYPPGHFEKTVASRAIKRIERPEDLVGGLLFLCSSESDFMTGQSLLIDGGNNMW